MLELKNVTKSYNKNTVKAVDSLTMTVNNGEIFGFLGPNGAGKTTSIRMLTGILQPDEGELLLDGISIKERPIAAKRTFAFVPDNPETFSRLKAIEYLDFISDVYKVPADQKKQRIEDYCAKFGLLENLNSRISSFSHGMKQKLAIISALIHEPKLIVMDEPFVGLDPKASFILKQIMHELCEKGTAIFFSTHVLDVAEKLCNKVAIIKQGKIITSGTMDELTHGASLEEAFLET